MTTKTQAPPDLQSQLLEQAMREAGPVLSAWFGEDGLRENLTKEIARDLAATPDDGVCTMELSGGGGRWAVVYIAPGEHAEPMPEAHIRHRNFALGDKRQLSQLAGEVRDQLGKGRPETVLAYTYGDKPLYDLRPDFHVVAGLIDELHLPADKREPQLRIEEPQSLDFYPTYREWYEEFWRRRPHLKDDIHVETREDIEECYNAGGVRLVYLNGELCGMCAAQPRFEYGLRGWRMRERVIAPAHWGKGLSIPLLVAFAQSLKHEETDAIWGTIHPENQWSLKTAQRAGRRIVATLHAIE